MYSNTHLSKNMTRKLLSERIILNWRAVRYVTQRELRRQVLLLFSQKTENMSCCSAVFKIDDVIHTCNLILKPFEACHIYTFRKAQKAETSFLANVTIAPSVRGHP